MAPQSQQVAQIATLKLRTVHLALRRSLQGIIDTAPQILVAQQKSFILYCDNFCEFLHHHHSNEDEISFPALAAPCGVEEEVARLEAEHKQIDPLTTAFQAVLHAPQYDGKAIAHAAAALQAHLIPHLDYEESLFTVDVMARAGEEKLKDTLDRIDAAAQKTDPFTQLPFFVNNLTDEEAELMVFGDAPWLLRSFLYPVLFSRPHKNVWRQFASRPGRA